ncbi:MAG: 30S ribosomal protein S8 [Candidatus Saganbacteria bacterium]|nr:30S ribosomal protein S8 [Candidatus Saganbacteria bacterium]
MVLTDPIADMISRIKNAIRTGAGSVEMPSSKIKEEIARILKSEGFISNLDVSTKKNFKVLTVYLKYGKQKKNMISGMKRISTPGRHIYVPFSKLPRVRGGFGSAILSTSSGLMADRGAREKRIGGEVLCFVW